MSEKEWCAVVAVARNGTIGRANTLPWKLRSDLQRFKKLTMGHSLIMGRKTFESIGKALPGRQTIVLSQSGQFRWAGVDVANSVEDLPAFHAHHSAHVCDGSACGYRGRCMAGPMGYQSI